MLREMFMGREPTAFKVNALIKAFIASEMLLWSAWNAITPIIAIFALQIENGGIQTAASAYSIYLIVRVIFELISGRLLLSSADNKKVTFTVVGIAVMSLAYTVLTFVTNTSLLFIAYGLIGAGIGIAAPGKNSLFATHLDKSKEAMEWGLQDAIVFFCMALAATAGGFIATTYGFQTLFIISAFVNLTAILPYILYIYKIEK
jgi:predicted MFS family arabinose efflux permease